MKLRTDQLDAHLKSQLKSIYLISGDEPFQQQEAADKIIKQAQNQGFNERKIWVIDSARSWDQLAASSIEIPLFSSKQIIDIRLTGNKLGKQGSQFIRAYSKRAPDNKVLVLRTAKLDASVRNSAWVKDLDKVGVMIQVWALSPAQTYRWVADRLRASGLEADKKAIRLLTERVEGNLLAASQEIQKMTLLLNGQTITEAQVIQVVSDSSRFTLFDLTEAILLADHKRVAHILKILREEGEVIPLLLWSLARLSRQLYEGVFKLKKGMAMNQVLSGIPRHKQALYEKAMQRLINASWSTILKYNAELDRLSKGQGDWSVKEEKAIWDKCQDYALRLSAYRKV